MSIQITSILFFDEFTSAGGGGVPYLNGNAGNKMSAQIDFNSFRSAENKFLRFTASGTTIENINQLDFTSFIQLGFKEGMTLRVTGTVSNNGTYTIVSVTAKIITVVESLVNEDIASGNLFDVTPVTALDFYYNLVGNGENYLSFVDRNAIQRYSADGLNSSSATPLSMLVTSSSFGWVTNTITNQTLGETDEVTIEGMDIVSPLITNGQSFRIKHTFFVSPLATADQLQNFIRKEMPQYFQGGRTLKYITKIDGKFDFANPTADHTGNKIDVAGRTCWYNENNIRSRAEYTFESIVYADAVNLNVLTELDIEKVVDVSITIKSRNGKFVPAMGTKFVLDFFYVPLNENRYINTPDTTLLQNFLLDRRFAEIGLVGDGENFGTPYQVLKTIDGVYVDAFTMRIDFKVDFSAEIKTFFKTLPKENRNYIFSVTTQDLAITTTIQTDRVNVISEVNQIALDKSNPLLIEAVDNIRVYHFPNIDHDPYTTAGGWEGDSIYIQFPFRLETVAENEITPTILKAGFQIVVVKSGMEDFVLEEKIFDSSSVCKLNGVQPIDISEIKNFLDVPFEYNVSFLKRDSSFDDGTMKGFLSHHAFVLKWDFWAKLIPDAERCKWSIFSEIENPTNAWNTLQQDGWSLKIRFLVEVKGYNDFVEVFDQYFDIDCKALGDAPDTAPIFTSETKYEDVETGILTNGIVAGKQTKITTTFLGDFAIFPAGVNSFFVYIFADIEGGGATLRRFAGSEFDSENSPFVAPHFNGIADSSWASANVRISIFGTEKVVMETIYDDTKEEWSSRAENILIYPKLGFYSGCFILTESGEYVLNEEGQRIQLETC